MRDDDAKEQSDDVFTRVSEELNQFRLYAEIAAVFEGCRKFDAVILPTLSGDTAREVQRGMARLEKSIAEPSLPVIPPDQTELAEQVLNAFRTYDLSTNDYHIYRRPGEAMILRWLEGEQVAVFYQRLQSHFDAMLENAREEHRWVDPSEMDEKTKTYQQLLHKADQIRLEERWFRDLVRDRGVCALSTQTVYEMNIAFLAEDVMGTSPEEVVGEESAVLFDPSEQDLAWFYKLFLLRGVRNGLEQMCFFTFLQKSNESW